MKIVVGEWFRMPPVGADVFKKLVNEAALKYDKSNGFQATPETNLALVASILKEALHENVEMLLNCFICGGAVECSHCRYSDICGGSSVFASCICDDCENSEETPSIYAIRFAQIAD